MPSAFVRHNMVSPSRPCDLESDMPAPRRHAALAVPFLLGLAGCGGDDAQFAPACPSAAIVRDGADLTRYRGPGQDLTDLTLNGRITGLQGKCNRADRGAVLATVTVGIELTRGPAAPGRTADLAYFVAVSQGERILDKRVFALRAEFPPNTDRVRLTGDDVELRLPTPPGMDASAYRIQVGLQLTPDELDRNRRRAAR